jgi:hypothetical protein
VHSSNQHAAELLRDRLGSADHMPSVIRVQPLGRHGQRDRANQLSGRIE